MAAALCALLLSACGKPELPRLAEGVRFPSVVLPDASGQPVRIEALRGRMVILNVWATWCPPCRREMPDLEALSKTLDPKHFAVIGLSTDRDRRLAQEFLLRNNISFPNYFDNQHVMTEGLELAVYPQTFVIAPDGVLLMRVTGFREWNSHEIVAELEDTYRDWQLKQQKGAAGIGAGK